VEAAECGLEEITAVLGVGESAGSHDSVDKVGGWIVVVVGDFGVVPDACQPASGAGGLF